MASGVWLRSTVIAAAIGLLAGAGVAAGADPALPTAGASQDPCASYDPAAPQQRAAYEACRRAARGDYCGEGERAVTRTYSGTTIDIYDNLGVRTPPTTAAGGWLEAGWGPQGAVCLTETRSSALPRCARSLRACDQQAVRSAPVLTYIRPTR